MKAQVKYLIHKAYMNLRYQWWKAKIFSTPNDPRITKLVKNEIYHHELMSATCAQLDRLPKHIPQPSDDHVDWFVGTIPHDWESRINERIKKKESNDVVD